MGPLYCSLWCEMFRKLLQDFPSAQSEDVSSKSKGDDLWLGHKNMNKYWIWHPFFVFTSSIKRENRTFHVVVVQWRQRNVQIAWSTCKVVVMPIETHSRLFCRSCCRRRRRCLRSLLFHPTEQIIDRACKFLSSCRCPSCFTSNFYNFYIGLPKLQNN